MGTVIAISDGKEITWNFQKSEANLENNDTVDIESDSSDFASTITYDYVANKNSKAFHYLDCASINKMKESNKEYITGTRNDAISMGYEPCGNCNP